MVVTNHEPEYGNKRFAIHSFVIVKIFGILQKEFKINIIPPSQPALNTYMYPVLLL